MGMGKPRWLRFPVRWCWWHRSCGIAPNVMNMAKEMIGPDPNIPSWVYLFGLALFFSLGGIVALIFGEKNLPKAFFLGLGLPALIASAQVGGPPNYPVSEPSDSPASSKFFSPSSVYAEEKGNDNGPSEEPPSGDHGQLTIMSLSECHNCILWFFNNESEIVGSKPFPGGENTTHSFSIPDGATRFGIWNASINPHLWVLRKEEAPSYNFAFDYNRNRWNDFRRSLGNYDLRPFDPTVSESEQHM